MVGLMSTQTDVATYMSAAAAAIVSGDHATAITNAQAAQALLAGQPDMKRTGEAGQEMIWDRPAVDRFIAQARRSQTEAAVAAASGPRRSSITYTRTS